MTQQAEPAPKKRCPSHSTGYTGAVNPCRITAKRQHQGRDYCTRHHNLILRDERIALWRLEQHINCPDHPDRNPRVYLPGQELYCTAKTGAETVTMAGPRGQRHITRESQIPTHCPWRTTVPAAV